MTAIDSARPWGYLATDVPLSQADAERIKKAWARAMDNPDHSSVPVLGAELRFVEFTYQQTPDAICLYCASANLNASFECRKCGAPLVHQAAQG